MQSYEARDDAPACTTADDTSPATLVVAHHHSLEEGTTPRGAQAPGRIRIQQSRQQDQRTRARSRRGPTHPDVALDTVVEQPHPDSHPPARPGIRAPTRQRLPSARRVSKALHKLTTSKTHRMRTHQPPGSALQIQHHLPGSTAAAAAGTKPFRHPNLKRCRRATIVRSAAADQQAQAAPPSRSSRRHR